MIERIFDGPGGPDADAGRVIMRVDRGSVEFEVVDFATGHGFKVPLTFDDVYEIGLLLRFVE